jgi:hypothetical protein
MQALRGKNINDSDEQVRGLEMKLIEFDDVDGSRGGGASGSGSGSGDAPAGLPYDYDPVALRKFFDSRPNLIAARIFQVLTTGGGVLFNFVVDGITGKLKSDPDWEVKRAGELRDTITSLGPFFIKLGQVRERLERWEGGCIPSCLFATLRPPVFALDGSAYIHITMRPTLTRPCTSFLSSISHYIVFIDLIERKKKTWYRHCPSDRTSSVHGAWSNCKSYAIRYRASIRKSHSIRWRGNWAGP